MNKNIYYYLSFSHCLGIGPIRFQKLLLHLQGIQKAYEAPYNSLVQILGQQLASKFVDFRRKFDGAKKLKELKEKNIHVITQEDLSYPSQLKNISDPPICLYVKGDVNNFDFSNPPAGGYFLGIVGTRKPSSYGQQIARKFAHELSSAGFIIVSGMAMGIDAIAHQAAIDNNQKTIAILGCGVDIIYPAINTKLYYQILEKGGLIISEFPPGHTVLKGLFIARNRLISGLSKGVLVIEGLADSGSLITARFAAEQGKEVFAPPAPLTSPMSQAPNNLLKQGAKLVTTVTDIIEEFGLKILPKTKKKLETVLNDEEKNIFDALQTEPKLVDEILEEKKLTIDTILNILSMLEIKGVVEKNAEGKYQIRY